MTSASIPYLLIDHNALSFGASLARQLVKWIRSEKIFTLWKLPDPFHQIFPQTNQKTPCSSNLYTALIMDDALFANGGEITCIRVKLITNLLKLGSQLRIVPSAAFSDSKFPEFVNLRSKWYSSTGSTRKLYGCTRIQ